ncbi:hypothetical protein BC940DRAFT_24474 [Gongronella butleri]|nr:hypothetical protein BC940DRAFT_24474 [Gongronella butleri]
MPPKDPFKSKQLTQNTIETLLHRAVAFVPSRYVDPKLELFKQKYAPVNDAKALTGVAKASEPAESRHGAREDEFEAASKVLFDAQRLDGQWSVVRPMGATLHAPQQDSALMAVLHCLTYTPVMANYLAQKWHSGSCTVADNCFVCALENHVKQVMANPGRQIAPRQFIGKLKRMKNGSRNNAHDVWQFFVDQIQQALLLEKGHKDKRVQATTALYQMYHGYVQDRVECQECHKTTGREYRGFLDLHVNIRQAGQLEKCIGPLFAAKTAAPKADAAPCPTCRKPTTVKRYPSIYQPPRVLTVHLDRFSAPDAKDEKAVKFSDTFDIARWLTPEQKGTATTAYRLNAMIVHQGGSSIHAGRFVAYVKGPNGMWYCLDDDTVQQVNGQRVLQQKPSILFYIPVQKFVPTRRAAKVQSASRVVEMDVDQVPAAPMEEQDEDDEIKLAPIDDEDKDEDEDKGDKDDDREARPQAQKVDSSRAIVVKHDDAMAAKHDKLMDLMQLEANEGKSLTAKNALLNKSAHSQFHQAIDSWDEQAQHQEEDTGVVQRSRSKLLKQLKNKRKKVDEHDMDYDRGKIKKIKTPKHDKFNQPNMFQAQADKDRS